MIHKFMCTKEGYNIIGMSWNWICTILVSSLPSFTITTFTSIALAKVVIAYIIS